MNPKQFTKKQKVRVIYDPNGMHIREEDVYELMQKYADQQLILHGVVGRSEQLPNECVEGWETPYYCKSELGRCKKCS